MEYGNPAARVDLGEHDWHFEHLPTGEMEVILASDITGTFSFYRQSVTFWSSFQRHLVIEVDTLQYGARHWSAIFSTSGSKRGFHSSRQKYESPIC